MMKLSTSVACCFLLSMSASMVYMSVFDPLLLQEELNQSYIALGSMLEVVNGVAVLGIAAGFYSSLVGVCPTLMLTYTALRVVEVSILIVGVVAGLLLPTLTSMEARAVVLACKHLCLQLAILLCGVGGAFILTPVLWRSRLVPRWLSAFGFGGYVAVNLSALLDVAGILDSSTTRGSLLYVPGGMFEAILLPLWLLFFGFRQPESLKKTR